MVDLAMRIFEFLTKFLVIWHPRPPWVCICSDLKPLETDMGDSSNCAILIWILAKSGLDPDIIHKIIFYNYQWQWEWELLELHNILVLKRESNDNGLKIQKLEWKFVKLLEQSDPRNPLSHMQFASYPQVPWPLHDVAASQVSIEWRKIYEVSSDWRSKYTVYTRTVTS